LPDLNPADFGVWKIIEKKMFKILIINLDELKQRLRTKWAKLYHIIIAAAIHQWRRQ